MIARAVLSPMQGTVDEDRHLSPNPDAQGERDTDEGQVCPACGCSQIVPLFTATDRLFETTDREFKIVECRRCRLIRLHPWPAPEELTAYYPPNYWFAPSATHSLSPPRNSVTPTNVRGAPSAVKNHRL